MYTFRKTIDKNMLHRNLLPCTPDFYFVTIVLGNKGEIKVKRPKGCHC